MSTSELEHQFLALWRTLARGYIEPVSEYRFHPTRKWRFDFCFPDAMVAVELEGGIWAKGRHVRGGPFIADCDKYNAAAILGWTVLRYTTNHLRERPVQTIEEIVSAITVADAAGGDDGTE